jgi:tetratricopeptide (TPR) repeat protein
MQNKRSPLMSLVLGLMLLSLIIFSGLPIVNSIFENNLLSQTDSVTAISTEKKAQLEAEANGYQKVLQREPENETALRELLSIRLQQQDLDSAIAPLETLTKIHPEQPEYGILLGQAKQYREDNEGAASAYRQVLKNQPGNIMALGGLVNLFLNQNLPERAIALLQTTINQAQEKKDDNLDLGSLQLLLGEVYTEAQKYSEAIALYDKVAQADTSDFRPLMAKALVLQKQEKTEEAKSLLESAYQLAPAEFKDRIKSEISNEK